MMEPQHPIHSRLSDVIFRHYLRSALVPILTIELILVVAYFSVSAWNTARIESTLRQEVSQSLPFVAQSQMRTIQQDLQQIDTKTNFFAQEHQRLLLNLDQYSVLGEQPLFAKAPNGVFYQKNRENFSSLYYASNTIIGPNELKIATKTAALDPLYSDIVKSTPHVVAAYYNSHDNMNRLHPFIPKVWEQFPVIMNMSEYNFYYLADQKHNPEKTSKWTGAYLDPAGNGWMVSCISPVYKDNTLQGVVGLDVTIENIVKNLLNQQLPWHSSAFLADDSGMILAMPENIENLLQLKELKKHVYDSAITKEKLKPEDYTIFNHNDKNLAAAFKNLWSKPSEIQVIQSGESELFVVQSRIPETGWRVVLLVESSIVYASSQKIAQTSKYIGWGVIFVMVIFYLIFFMLLQANAKKMAKKISSPIATLAEATSSLATAESFEQKIPLVGIPEIDQLTKNFNLLSSELEDRTKQLVANHVEIAMKSKDSELAYARGMYESASGYLHNVGNLAMRLGSQLMDLKNLTNSTLQFPEVFRRIRSQSDPDIVDRFESNLLNKFAPTLSNCTSSIEDIHNHIQKSIASQQSTFLSNYNQPVAQSFDLVKVIQSSATELAKLHNGSLVTVHIDAPESLHLKTQKEQLSDGIDNLLKNAYEAVSNNGNIWIRIKEVNSKQALIEIQDDGVGIDTQLQSKLLAAGFTTKANGHGLGLHSFALFLTANKGKISIESAGINQGTTVKVELNHA